MNRTEFEKILINRDGKTIKEAKLALEDARKRVSEGENPEEILFEEYGLAPDYLLDLVPFTNF